MGSMREWLTDFSKGDGLGAFWRMFRWRERTRRKLLQDVLTFLLHRSARRYRESLETGRGWIESGLNRKGMEA